MRTFWVAIWFISFVVSLLVSLVFLFNDNYAPATYWLISAFFDRWMMEKSMAEDGQ